MQVMPPGELMDVLTKRGGCGDIPVCEVLLEALFGHIRGDIGVFDKGIKFGGKREGSLLKCIEQGLFAEAIATKKKLPSFSIINAEGPVFGSPQTNAVRPPHASSTQSISPTGRSIVSLLTVRSSAPAKFELDKTEHIINDRTKFFWPLKFIRRVSY